MTDAELEAALLAQIDVTLTRLDAKTAELYTSIAENLHLLPEPLQSKTIEGWKDFCSYLQRLWHNLAIITTNIGSPTALWETADAWNIHVGAPVSAHAQTADTIILGVDNYWTGDAADAYQQMLPAQKAALEKIRTLTVGVTTALDNVAKSILVFLAALIGAIAALVTGIIGALASTATIAGIPAGILIACGAALTACAAFIAGAERLKGDCSSANTTLRQHIADNTAFYQGRWPEAVIA